MSYLILTKGSRFRNLGEQTVCVLIMYTARVCYNTIIIPMGINYLDIP